MKAIIDLLPHFTAIFACIAFYNLCYAKINNHKLELKIKNIVLIFIATILVLLNNYFTKISLKVLINYVILSSEIKLTFKDNIKKVIINYIFMYMLINIIEIITTNLLLFSGVLTNNSSANSVSYVNTFLTILVGIIEYLILCINLIRIYFSKIVNFFIKNETINYIAYLVFVTGALLSMLNIQIFENKNSIYLIILLSIIFTILFVLVIRLKYHEEILKLTNRKLIDYNDNYSKFLDEYKIYKHNINHKLSAMKSFGNKKINALIDDLLEEETNFSIRNNEIYNIPNGIKGIVAEKLYNKEYDVLIHNKVENDPFSNLDPKTFNSISEALGIALDNAVEASEETKNPIIIMDLYEDKENLYLKVGNNYCNNIDLDELGNKYYSTKNRGSGLGLFSIKRNNLVKERIEIINSFFYIELQIKKAR